MWLFFAYDGLTTPTVLRAGDLEGAPQGFPFRACAPVGMQTLSPTTLSLRLPNTADSSLELSAHILSPCAEFQSPDADGTNHGRTPLVSRDPTVAMFFFASLLPSSKFT